MGFLANGWKGRGLSTRANFAFSVVSNQELQQMNSAFTAREYMQGWSWWQRMLQFPRKGQAKNYFADQQAQTTCSPKTEELLKWLAPLLGPNELASEGPQANCHTQYCRPIIKDSAVSAVCFPPPQAKAKNNFKSYWKKTKPKFIQKFKILFSFPNWVKNGFTDVEIQDQKDMVCSCCPFGSRGCHQQQI